MLINIDVWLWVAVAAVFAIIEFLTVTFFGLWMALAALVPALIVLIFQSLSLTAQLFIWAIASLLCAMIWVRWIRSKPAVQLSSPLLGQEGILAGTITPGELSIVLFSKPIQSRQEWPCFSSYTLPRQTRVRVIAVDKDNQLEVTPINPSKVEKEL